MRRAGFAVVTRFFYKGQAGTGACWEAAALAEGIRKFSVRRSLLEEVPALPEIVKRELLPALKPLKVGGIVSKVAANPPRSSLPREPRLGVTHLSTLA